MQMLIVVRVVAQYNYYSGNLLKLQRQNKLQNKKSPPLLLSLTTHSLYSSKVYCQLAALQLAVLTVGSNDS